MANDVVINYRNAVCVMAKWSLFVSVTGFIDAYCCHFARSEQSERSGEISFYVFVLDFSTALGITTL